MVKNVYKLDNHDENAALIVRKVDNEVDGLLMEYNKYRHVSYKYIRLLFPI
jgi:hypothetical protein